MALSTRPTLAALRSMCRDELMDQQGRWWSDDVLDVWINDWQKRVQDEFEFARVNATATINQATTTISTLAPDVMRVDACFWNQRRLVPKSVQEMDLVQHDWRVVGEGGDPKIVYHPTPAVVGLWPPPPAVGGRLDMEYVRELSLADDVATIAIPAWTKFSCKNFVAWRAYSQRSPNQSLDKARRYRAKFERQMLRYASIWANYHPQRSPHLRPGGRYESEILDPLGASAQMRR